MALRGKKVLIVITSHGTLGKTKAKSGTWLEELAAPYYTFVDNNAEVTLASPKGGQPPVDPRSEQEEMQTEDTKRFLSDARARQQFANTVKLANIDTTLANFDAVFYPGGHGPLFDLVDDPQSITILKSALIDGKVIGAVCHGPAVFRNVKGLDGMPMVHRKNVTGFSNSEERAMGTENEVPFSLEDVLKSQNAIYTKADDWKPHVVVDGLLVTGQNPASSKEVAQSMVRLLKAKK